MSGKTLPNYLHVFEQRLGSIRNKLQAQLDLPKEKRERGGGGREGERGV